MEYKLYKCINNEGLENRLKLNKIYLATNSEGVISGLSIIIENSVSSFFKHRFEELPDTKLSGILYAIP